MLAATLLFFAILYALFFFALFCGIRRLKRRQRVASLAQKPTFSILVAARNEEANVPTLLASFEELEYPSDLFEVIVIDDQSTDATSAEVEKFNASYKLTLIQQKTAGVASKKSALAKGVQVATGEFIAVTDADCRVPKAWLNAFAAEISRGAEVVAAPVFYSMKKATFFQKVVAIDFMSLISFGAGLIGINRPVICNGANFCYAKSAFLEVDGFAGVDAIASGDDDLLLQKFAVAKKPISYAWQASALVETSAPETPTAFLRQRKRWGSKGASYPNVFNRLVMFFMFFSSVVWAIAIVLLLTSPSLQIVATATICLKILAEIPVMIEAKKLFRPAKFWRLVPIVTLLQIPYVIGVGIWASFGSYTWKES